MDLWKGLGLDYLCASLVWLEENFMALAQVFAAVITALATIALWRVTGVLAVETTRLANMTAQPFVVCWLESSPADPIALNLTFRNTGNATAFDIKMVMSPGLPVVPDKDGPPPDLDTELVFETSLIPPGQAVTTRGAMGPQVRETVFDVKISWSLRPNSMERENLEYSFHAKDGFTGGFRTYGIHQIAAELEKIQEKLPDLKKTALNVKSSS